MSINNIIGLSLPSLGGRLYTTLGLRLGRGGVLCGERWAPGVGFLRLPLGVASPPPPLSGGSERAALPAKPGGRAGGEAANGEACPPLAASVVTYVTSLAGGNLFRGKRRPLSATRQPASLPPSPLSFPVGRLGQRLYLLIAALCVVWCARGLGQDLGAGNCGFDATHPGGSDTYYWTYGSASSPYTTSAWQYWSGSSWVSITPDNCGVIGSAWDKLFRISKSGYLDGNMYIWGKRSGGYSWVKGNSVSSWDVGSTYSVTFNQTSGQATISGGGPIVYGITLSRTNTTGRVMAFQVCTNGVEIYMSDDFEPLEVWSETFYSTNSVPSYTVSEAWLTGDGELFINPEAVPAASWGTNSVTQFSLSNPWGSGPQLGYRQNTNGSTVLNWSSAATGSGGNTAGSTEGTMRQGFDQLAAVVRDASQAQMKQASSIADVADGHGDALEGLGAIGNSNLSGISNYVAAYSPGLTNLGAYLPQIVESLTNTAAGDRAGTNSMLGAAAARSATEGYATEATGINQGLASDLTPAVTSPGSVDASKYALQLRVDDASSVVDWDIVTAFGTGAITWFRSGLAFWAVWLGLRKIYGEAMMLPILAQLVPSRSSSSPWTLPLSITLAIASCALICEIPAAIMALLETLPLWSSWSLSLSGLFPLGSGATAVWWVMEGIKLLWMLVPVEVYLLAWGGVMAWRVVGQGLFLVVANVIRVMHV